MIALQNCPSARRHRTLSNTWFSHFCRTHDRDRPTEHTTRSVTIGHINVVLWYGPKTRDLVQTRSAHADGQVLPTLGATFQCVHILLLQQLCHKHLSDADVERCQSDVDGARDAQVTGGRSLDQCLRVHVVYDAQPHGRGVFLRQTSEPRSSITAHPSSALSVSMSSSLQHPHQMWS